MRVPFIFSINKSFLHCMTYIRYIKSRSLNIFSAIYFVHIIQNVINLYAMKIIWLKFFIWKYCTISILSKLYIIICILHVYYTRNLTIYISIIVATKYSTSIKYIMSLYILQLAMRVFFLWKYDYDLEIAI